jgi:8-hydroxy-5-deazaflavin:NADPH oxidoreductase
MPSKKIGILGSGPVGQALAKGFATVGYEVKIGSRSPEKLKDWIEKEGNGKISAGTFEEVARFGDVDVLATHGEATESAIDLAVPRNFAHKLVIDAANPLDFSKGMPPGALAKYSTKSLGEHVQQKLPDSKVVKCFNTVPNSLMFRPKFDGVQMLICGNNQNAKQEVTNILKQFGWAGSIDVGGIENARLLEALVLLWVRAAVATESWNSMFALVK